MNCIICNKEILSTSNRKYCIQCKEEKSREAHRKNYQEHAEERREYQERYAKARGISGCIERGRSVSYGFIKRALRGILYSGGFENTFDPDYGPDDEDEQYVSNYLGSTFSLDPCGKYHHMLSPNGVTKTCEKFWENLSQAAEDLGGWIESGEGDACDIFFCFTKSVYDKKVKNHDTHLRRKVRTNVQ